MKRLGPLVVGFLMTAGSAAAQVGYPPARSPYLDLEHAQELTLIVGQFHGHRDPANVAPGSGLIVGAHYEWRAGGPAHIVGEFSRISSERRVINPLRSGTAHELGTLSRPLYTANVGLGISATGGKSWHHIVPELTSGVGLISDFRSQADSGGFKFGTRFALNWGAGVRWVPGGHWQVRGDITNRMYTVAYPETFYIAPSGGQAVVSPQQARSFWTNNPAFTLGISRLF